MLDILFATFLLSLGIFIVVVFIFIITDTFLK